MLYISTLTTTTTRLYSNGLNEKFALLYTPLIIPPYHPAVLTREGGGVELGLLYFARHAVLVQQQIAKP